MAKKIEQLHFLTRDIPFSSHLEMARQALDGGVKWVQLRVKNKDFSEWIRIAEDVKKSCENYQATFIINDSPEVAKATQANGVHLGKTDMSVEKARVILGDSSIIGGTANTREDIRLLLKSGVDYIGLGPFRFTQTKKNLSPVIGLEGYCNLIAWYQAEGFTTPLIAIGGIQLEDVKPLLETGIHGMAVSSAINQASSPSTAAKQFMQAIVPENIFEKEI